MSDTSERREVVVVGGGQAGLAIGYYLADQGRHFTILESAGEPAAAWRARWDSLTLFTPVRYDSLPGLPFPGDPDTYPGRDDVAEYLTEYALRFDLPIEYDSRVRSIRANANGYLVDAPGRTYQADQVVVATGPFQVPRVPTIAQEIHPAVLQFHSSEYRNPEALPPGPVLVVGGGNTGFQISAELAATHEVHLSIGSRQMPLPQRFLGRDLFRWLEGSGVMRKTVDSRIGRRMMDRDTLIGSRPRSLRRRHGVRLHDRAVAASGTAITFADGSHVTASAVIWATGFDVDHAWIDAPIFDAPGRVRHKRGVTDSPGLYFLGLPWQHTRGSALLGWVKDDAAYLAERIRDRAGIGSAPAAATPLAPAERLATGEHA